MECDTIDSMRHETRSEVSRVRWLCDIARLASGTHIGNIGDDRGGLITLPSRTALCFVLVLVDFELLGK